MSEMTIENLRQMAEQAGLKLGDDELHSLLPGVNRARRQAAELRCFTTASDEPASSFLLSSKRLD